jgi:hypothetical protein
MTRNMGALDRRLRTFVVAPAAIVTAIIVDADSGFSKYRHGDSNPGFRRERAAS